MKVHKQIVTRAKDGSSIQFQLYQRADQRNIELRGLGTQFTAIFTEQAFLEDFFPNLRELAVTSQLFIILEGIANWDWTFWYDELVLRAKHRGISENEVKHWLNTSKDFYVTKYGLCMPYGPKTPQKPTTPILAYLPSQKRRNHEESK